MATKESNFFTDAHETKQANKAKYRYIEGSNGNIRKCGNTLDKIRGIATLCDMHQRIIHYDGDVPNGKKTKEPHTDINDPHTIFFNILYHCQPSVE